MILLRRFIRSLIKNESSTRGCCQGNRNIHCTGATFSRDVKLHYVRHEKDTTSDQPPIFIAHGLFGNHKNWNSLSRRLNNLTGRTVITYDAVNHGLSAHHQDMSYIDMAEDLLSLMDRLHVEQTTIIGHSMGGKTVMSASLLHPERFDKMVVVDVAPDLSKSAGEVFTYMNGMKAIDMSQMTSRQDVENEVKKFAKSSFIVGFLMTNLDVEPHLKWRINLDAMINNYKYIHDFPDFDESAVFDGPTQFIGGAKSNYLTEADHPIIKKRFPSSNIIKVPDAGHWVHSEKPKEFLEIAAKFING